MKESHQNNISIHIYVKKKTMDYSFLIIIYNLAPNKIVNEFHELGV